MKLVTIIVLLLAAVGVYMLLTEGTGLQAGWPQKLWGELKGWRQAYGSNKPFAGSSHPA